CSVHSLAVGIALSGWGRSSFRSALGPKSGHTLLKHHRGWVTGSAEKKMRRVEAIFAAAHFYLPIT
ncbi:MAG: hypothetical protein VCB43_15100, partial [Myxococcota bacterium]